eukprot:TRINITY_DN6191_c2_g3_i1.p1 TRINITY_DN6191_c2_g3~~TRINITY_DN6191_c2_g3_i1.p1  ORF type:complete len:400 (+),score=69.60 TRINITY_DN6191_c2_g3_i1:47-1246(+)
MMRTRRKTSSITNIMLNLVLCMSIMAVIYLIKQATGADGLFSPDVVIEERGSEAGMKLIQDDIRDFLLHHDATQPALARQDFKEIRQIKRIPAKNLSFRDFYDNYEMTGTPLVISNITVKGKWTLKDIGEICKDSTVNPLTPTKRKGTNWANLKAAEKGITVKEFVKQLDDNVQPSPYMHDWSVQKNCPKLLEEYVVPKYYAQDYLRNLETEASGAAGAFGGTMLTYGETWPSLFVGEKSTGSGFHVDSGDTHFVMHMIEGRKHFRLIRNLDRVAAYEDRNRGTFTSDLFKPDFGELPLLALLTVYETVLGPGEILFVPGGSAHQVVNLSPTIGISTNFIDNSNIQRCISQFETQLMFDVADALKDGLKTKSLATEMDPSDLNLLDANRHRARYGKRKP